MIEKYAGGKVPERPAAKSPFARGAAEEFLPRLSALLRRDRPDETLELLLSHADRANRFIEERKPWELAKKNETGTLLETLYELAEFLRILAIAAEPFLPAVVLKMRESLAGAAGNGPALAWGGLEPGRPLKRGAVLFPRIE